MKRTYYSASYNTVPTDVLTPASKLQSCASEPGTAAIASVPIPTGTFSEQGNRKYQEDRALVLLPTADDHCHLLIAGVFDGHGGQEVSSLLHEHLLPTLLSGKPPYDAFHEMNDRIAAAGLTSGSTAVTVCIDGLKVTCANCGDSRAVMGVMGGPAIPLSKDHGFDDCEAEIARIHDAGGHVFNVCGKPRVNGVLNMTRAIGDLALRPFIICDPDVKIFYIGTENDVIVIGTDGLWDVMTNDQAVDIVRRVIARCMYKGTNRNNICKIAARLLTKAALAKGSVDNITAVVIDLLPHRAAVRAFPLPQPHHIVTAPAPAPAPAPDDVLHEPTPNCHWPTRVVTTSMSPFAVGRVCAP